MGKSGGGSGGGGGASPQVIQPEMPQHPLLSQGLIPAAMGRLGASMPWLQSGMRTMDYFNSPQFNTADMQTPQFNQQQYGQQYAQQQGTAQGWQRNLDSMFPSPWGSMLSYAGQNGTYRTPTQGQGPGGMGQAPQMGGGAPIGGPAGGGGSGNNPDLERYISRDPQSGAMNGGFFETPEQWAQYNGFAPPQQNMFQIPQQAPQLQTGGGTTPQAMGPQLRTGGGATPQAMGPQLRTGGGNTPQAMGPQIPRNF